MRGGDDHATRMIRDLRYKLIYYPTGNHFQLFDLEQDPKECVGSGTGPEACGNPEGPLQRNCGMSCMAVMKTGCADGAFVGYPDKPYVWAPHRSLNSQRGDGWPPSPMVDIPQIEWTQER